MAAARQLITMPFSFPARGPRRRRPRRSPGPLSGKPGGEASSGGEEDVLP